MILFQQLKFVKGSNDLVLNLEPEKCRIFRESVLNQVDWSVGEEEIGNEIGEKLKSEFGLSSLAGSDEHSALWNLP